ncbi:MAG: mevalonate kinase [Gammaproteobacteria bacterium RIFCSPHIGHO2_12_FULL_43_28]|nr:MAG: mevalonate kinase [Gammaproteobacteria bacterium RIFCSPHIGHO2_12_FULL_43_28]
MQLKASAPASLMLLGEFGVLHNKLALVCAVDKRIHVSLTARSDAAIHIHSALGNYSSKLTKLSVEKPFQFVLAAIKTYQARYKTGFDLTIESEFSSTIGLGSSAAVTVATLAALVTSLNIKMTPLDLVRQARHVIRQVQGTGSGADAAAAVYGGMVAYQSQPLFAEKLPAIHPLSVLYSGHKTPTVEVIKIVRERYRTHSDLFQSVLHCIGKCAEDGIKYARRKDWVKLGEVMNVQQGMMESLGVSTPLLYHMVMDLRKQPKIVGAKISGSGLGDCVIGLGEMQLDYKNANSAVQPVLVQMSPQGVQCEKS